MASLKGTKTEVNLLTAFAGEAQARNRYTYFASKARKEGYVQIADIFAETADQEKEHAKRFFKFLEGGDVEITAAFPAGVIGSTLENLREAAAGEHHEQAEMYPGMAKEAREEGFNEIAEVFERVSVAERFHEKRFGAFAANIEAGTVFKRMRRWFGAAATVVTSTKAPRPPNCARPAPIPRPTLRLNAKTGNDNNTVSTF